MEKGIPSIELIFIDANKPNNPHYLKWALKLANAGGIIIADNVVRNGKVIAEESKDERVQGIRRFMNLLKNKSSIESTAIQTVGKKGYEGFVISVVK